MRSRLLVSILVTGMLGSVVWRLGHPPVSPRQEQWLAAGLKNLEIGRYGFADERFRKVLSINPANKHAQELFAIVSVRPRNHSQNALQRAGERLLEAQQMYPDSSYVAMLGGEIALDNGKPDDAIALHTKVASDRPGIPQNWYDLGLAQRAAGNHVAALEGFEKAVNLNAQVRYLLELGQQLFYLHRWLQAADIFKQTIEKNPWRLDARLGQFRALAMAGETTKALILGEKLITLLSKDSEAVRKRVPYITLVSSNAPFRTIGDLTGIEYLQYVHIVVQFLGSKNKTRTESLQLDYEIGNPILSGFIREDIKQMTGATIHD